MSLIEVTMKFCVQGSKCDSSDLLIIWNSFMKFIPNEIVIDGNIISYGEFIKRLKEPKSKIGELSVTSIDHKRFLRVGKVAASGNYCMITINQILELSFVEDLDWQKVLLFPRLLFAAVYDSEYGYCQSVEFPGMLKLKGVDLDWRFKLKEDQFGQAVIDLDNNPGHLWHLSDFCYVAGYKMLFTSLMNKYIDLALNDSPQCYKRQQLAWLRSLEKIHFS